MLSLIAYSSNFTGCEPFISNNNPICSNVITFHAHLLSTCHLLVLLKSIISPIVNFLNWHRILSNAVSDKFIQNHVHIYLFTHLVQYIIIYNIGIQSIHHTIFILNHIYLLILKYVFIWYPN